MIGNISLATNFDSDIRKGQFFWADISEKFEIYCKNSQTESDREWGSIGGFASRPSVEHVLLSGSGATSAIAWHTFRSFSAKASTDLFWQKLFRRSDGVSLEDVEEASHKLATLEHSGNGRVASFFAVYFIERSHKYRAYEAINKLLEDADVDELSPWSLVALLRSSFPLRKYLPAWPPLLEQVRGKLENSGEDAAKILRGLRPD